MGPTLVSLCHRSLPPGIGTSSSQNSGAHYSPRRHSLLEFRLAGRSTLTPTHGCLVSGVMCITHVTLPMVIQSRSSSPSSWSAAQISMLTPCALLCILMSVAMLCAFKILSNTALHSWRELEWVSSSTAATMLLWVLEKSRSCMRHATALVYHVHTVASCNKLFTNCGTSGKLTLWTYLSYYTMQTSVLYFWYTLYIV